MTDINISVSEVVHKKIKELKEKLGTKTFNEVLNLLLQFYELKNKEYKVG